MAESKEKMLKDHYEDFLKQLKTVKELFWQRADDTYKVYGIITIWQIRNFKKECQWVKLHNIACHCHWIIIDLL
jgi:hypothetical protein